MGRRAKPGKVKVKAKRPLVRKSPTEGAATVHDLRRRLAESLEREKAAEATIKARDRALTEALDQQTATSEILRVISSSPTDMQPVFDAIARNARGLLAGHSVSVTSLIGDEVHLMAFNTVTPEGDAVLRAGYPVRLDQWPLAQRTLREGTATFVEDVETHRDTTERTRRVARARGFRSFVWMPMVHGGATTGWISITWAEPGPFSESHIALLQTFANQAVIAIENVRLFTELQRKNEALTQAHAQVTEALEQRTATSEILRVISASPTDVQPVFDAIAANAARLCDAVNGLVIRFDGRLLHLAAHYNVDPERLAAVRQSYPRPPSRGALSGRAVLMRAVVHVPDVSKDPEYTLPVATTIGYRSVLAVPMMRDAVVHGTILVARGHVAPFSDTHIALIQTFADQAVIAIENVRLFTELQEKNQALTTAHAQVTEALEQQTATSEILKVIASSPTDTQPVFDAIAENAARLCSVEDVFIVLVARDALRAVAATGQLTRLIPDYNARRVPVSRASVAGRVIVDRTTIHIDDLAAVPEDELPDGRALQRMFNHRTILATPLLREGAALGAIVVFRLEVRPFSERQQDLLQTFADQAVIAVENVRLFKELEARTADLIRSVEQLTALGEVGRAVSSTLDLETVLTTIVSRAVELSGLDGGVVFEYDEGEEAFVQRAATEQGGPLAEARRATRIRKGEGVVGRTAITLEPVQVPDISVPGAYESRLRDNLIASGVRAILAVPMVREERLIGNLVVTRNRPGEFLPGTIELLRTFATQSALAIQNARLFRQLEIKSRELEVASQHKSEFLASMSHELRTPLNAIIGFSDVLLQGMFGEMTGKQTEYLQDILASGQHLLSLINDILDLSKIEAGRMELDLADFHLPSAIDDALLLMRERAGRRGITLERHIDERVGEIRGDQRKVKQVLLNLLSNAVKFTPEGGRIDVRAGLADGTAEISVTDTGIGIAPEDHDAVFEEFRQVGTADKKAEGTGLGLALCRKFVELHGGRIWVKSQIGQGSTFTFTLPLVGPHA